MSVSAILNLYKRGHTLREQYEAIVNQTSPPDEILIWSNAPDLSIFDQEILSKCKVATSNFNFGVWSRYAFALCSKGDYIALFDDDSIPNPKWIENCIEEQKKEECVLASVAIQFYDLTYRNYTRFGWPSLNNEKVLCDFGGHSLFFPRRVLGEYWNNAPVPESSISGEDIHLSYSAQRLGLKTYSAAHPENNKEIWGCDPEKSMRYGVEKCAISVNYHGTHFADRLVEYNNKGFKFLKF